MNQMSFHSMKRDWRQVDVPGYQGQTQTETHEFVVCSCGEFELDKALYHGTNKNAEIKADIIGHILGINWRELAL